ncbi:MAG: type-F conjugative transfer system pilin assembly protein TrbC [Chloroflexi bacterium]|nr:type-F conjugative transfer system pilin assembly protein TrbC [Chloroflexota bacterium]
MLPPLNRSDAARVRAVAAGLVCALVLAACCGPARADDASARASELAEEVLREAGGADLGAWTREVIGRALERAGKAASGTAAGIEAGKMSPVPLAAERHAAPVARGLAGSGDGAEVIVFTSLSVPAASWRQWARDAARTGTPLVLRGVGEGGLRATVKEIGTRLGRAQAGVAIDPRLFRLFGVERVPAVVVVPGGVAPCRSRGCSADPAPPHDLVAGNVGLAAALEAVAAEGDAGRDAARRHLDVLRGEE